MNAAALAGRIAAGASDIPHADTVLALPLAEVLALAEALDTQRRQASDRFVRVRCAAWLVALYRFRLQADPQLPAGVGIPVEAWRQRLQRRYREAVDGLQALIAEQGLGQTLASELAQVFHGLQYAELAELVRSAVREQRGNRWMFRCGSLLEYPLALRPALLRAGSGGQYPLLEERTAVRLDFTHSGWSDIFFLAMQAPEAAAVVNWSVNIAEDDGAPRPPIRTHLRVIDEPLLRLTAVDLGETVDLHDLAAVFDFSRDHLGLLKAAVVASGLVPAALEGTDQSLTHLLNILCGPGRGLELVSEVARIPKGSRLAVSTNLLGSLIAVCMRASGQTAALSGPLSEEERRVVASRAILGEWLGGSGGGWQDSGGLWPGLKIMRGARASASAGDAALAPGALLPDYESLTLSADAQRALEGGLVVFHGGMSGNVGPVLELVTSRFLLHWEEAATARAALLAAFPKIITALRSGDLRSLGALTQGLFQGPLRRIIPGVSNAYVDDLIATAQAAYGEAFYGFVMLGGMAGGGMAMVVDPAQRAAVDASWPQHLQEVAARHRSGLPFVVPPRVLRVGANTDGSSACLHCDQAAVMSPAYYEVHAPLMTALRERDLSPRRRQDLLAFLAASQGSGHGRLLEGVVRNLLPQPAVVTAAGGGLAAGEGVDIEHQRALQRAYRAGDMSLVRNRLPERSEICDIDDGDLCRATGPVPDAAGVAVVTLAGGLGSRWSGGAGVVKALAPIAELGGRWRSFLDIHLAKYRRQRLDYGIPLPQVITTSFLTHQPIAAAVEAQDPDQRHSLLSRGALLNQRVIPTAHDLHHYFCERPRPRLDAQAQKAREDGEQALMAWAASLGAGQPYPGSGIEDQCNPPGHWWEIPSLLLNGTLQRLLQQQPELHTLLLHNIDTLGVTYDPAIAAAFAASGAVCGVEVIPRLAGDSGGALARVDGQPRLVESLAMPDESIELGLRWYNSNTWWLNIDGLLGWFGLSRADLADSAKVRAQILNRSRRLPTYVTIKDVRRSWGNGHADIVPVAQFEQLWGDMSAADDCPTVYLPVERGRGQQLKDIGQVPDWISDGSAAAITALL